MLEVFSHENAPRLAAFDQSYKDQVAVPGVPLRPLHDAQIYFSGQPVALVVAEQLEIARYAATLVRVEYEVENHATDLAAERGRAYQPPEQRGEIGAVADTARRRGTGFCQRGDPPRREYYHPIEHHNAMELYRQHGDLGGQRQNHSLRKNPGSRKTIRGTSLRCSATTKTRCG